MGKRIVIALGGNALGKNLPEQMAAVKHTARAIVDLIEEGHQVVVAHGNGPQVGMINTAMTTLSREDPTHPMAPMSVCTAMSQGYIGYDLQNSLREELLDRGIHKAVATILTQVEVDPEDPAFQNPTKPIGTFMTEAEAEEMRRRGKITEADARTHPQKNLITRAVGVEPCVEGDLFEVRLNEKDMLLLCSDGLTGMAEDSRIAEVLANAPTLELAGDALLQLALDGGGRDNITVALFTLGKKQGA